MANTKFKKGDPKLGGRKKGTPNKTTTLIKDMVLQALDQAGGVKYLLKLSDENPAAFCTLLGKVIPLNLTSEDGTMSPPTTIIIRGPDAD
jgi:hypothetical protein